MDFTNPLYSSLLLCQLGGHQKSHGPLCYVQFGSRRFGFSSFMPLLKVLQQPVWHNSRRQRQSEIQTKNWDRGFAMFWAFNLSKWRQGLQPAHLIIPKLNLGQRISQTHVFIKMCADFSSFVFHAAYTALPCDTTAASRGCIFYMLKVKCLNQGWFCFWSLKQLHCVN